MISPRWATLVGWIVFVVWTALVVVSMWRISWLPADHGKTRFPIQLVAFASVPFAVVGIPKLLVVHPYIGPRAKGLRQSILAVAILVGVTLAGWGVDLAVNGPIVVDEERLHRLSHDRIIRQQSDCLQAIWFEEKAWCQLVYVTDPARENLVSLVLDDVICVRWQGDHARSTAIERCVRADMSTINFFDQEANDAVRVLGEVEVVAMKLMQGTAVTPSVELAEP